MYSGSTEKIRSAILLRYRMLPHLYSLEYQAHQTGAPIMRPLVYEFQQDPQVYEIDDLFLIGRDLLVANVLEKGAQTRSVYLPKGAVWYDLENNYARYEGGQTIEIPVTIDSIPRFIREGGIIPEAANQLYSMEKDRVTGLKLLTAPSDDPDAVTEYVHYNDDGITNAFEEGAYRWEIRAYTYETELASRRSGKVGQTDFRLRKIRPVVLTSPENNKVFGGWEAIEHPPLLTWKSPEAFSYAELVLKKVSGIEAGEKLFVQKTTEQQLGELSSGVYEWTVNAKTEDELDISAGLPHRFTVEELPPFPVPEKAATEGTYFDAPYLRQSQFIDFSWTPVKRAGAYILEITDKKGKLLHREVLEGNDIKNYRFTELSKLSKGKFSWKLRAVRINKETNEVVIDGKPAEGSFEINFTLNTNGGKRRKNGELYGQ